MFDAFADLSTPLLADACIRLDVALRVAPPGVVAVTPGSRLCGHALPVRHYGSVDVFLEAIELARPGDVLVIDNGGRADEACIGDLVVLEAKAANVSGVFVWGLHRDNPDLVQIGLPVFSYGRCPLGPTRLDEREAEALTSARVGDFVITTKDVVLGDDDGVLFISESRAVEVFEAADHIWQVERDQASRIRAGESLRRQVAFAQYLDRRATDRRYTFRLHLRRVGGAIEE